MEAKINAAAHSVREELKCHTKNYVDSGLCLCEELGKRGSPRSDLQDSPASAVHSGSQQTDSTSDKVDGEAQREAGLGTPHTRFGIHALAIT